MDFIKKTNETVCSIDGFLGGYCVKSTKPKKMNDALFLIGIALFVQYVVPIFIALISLAFVVANVIAGGTIGFLTIINPFSMLLIIPVAGVDLLFILVMFAIWVSANIYYWWGFGKELGVLVLLPIGMTIISFLINFIPYVGQALSSIISIIPWMAIAVGIHLLTTRE